MDELFKLLQTVLEKLPVLESEIPEVNEAKKKLISKLTSITNEISSLQNQSEQSLTQEQINEMIEKMVPEELRWKINGSKA
jgi:peptidoglycan hydrolase CwlO-like protein